MFEAIIFLTGVVERTALRAALLGHNAALNVLTIESALDLAALRYVQERIRPPHAPCSAATISASRPIKLHGVEFRAVVPARLAADGAAIGAT